MPLGHANRSACHRPPLLPRTSMAWRIMSQRSARAVFSPPPFRITVSSLEIAIFLAWPSMEASAFSSLKPRSSLTTWGDRGAYRYEGVGVSRPDSRGLISGASIVSPFRPQNSQPGPLQNKPHRGAGQHCDVLQVRLAVVAKAGGLDGADLDARTQLVDDEGGQGLCRAGREVAQTVFWVSSLFTKQRACSTPFGTCHLASQATCLPPSQQHPPDSTSSLMISSGRCVFSTCSSTGMMLAMLQAGRAKGQAGRG